MILRLFDVRVPHPPCKPGLLDALTTAYRTHVHVPPPVVLVRNGAVAITGSHRIAAMKRASMGAIRLSSPTLLKHLMVVDCTTGVNAEVFDLAVATQNDVLGDYNRLCATASAYLGREVAAALVDQFAVGYQPPVTLRRSACRARGSDLPTLS